MILVQPFVFNPFSENTYLLYDETNSGVLIDPGCFQPNEYDELERFIATKDIQIKYILITHGHVDHVLGVTYVKKKFNVPVWLHAQDIETYNAVPSYAASYGFTEYTHTLADHLFNDHEEIHFGNSHLEIISAPGHSAGHVAFVNKKEKICIGGDILFKGSIGRVDLPGGDYDTLISSIKSNIFTLPEDTIVYPGHGEPTTIKIEKDSNPFFQ